MRYLVKNTENQKVKVLLQAVTIEEFHHLDLRSSTSTTTISCTSDSISIQVLQWSSILRYLSLLVVIFFHKDNDLQYLVPYWSSIARHERQFFGDSYPNGAPFVVRFGEG